MIYNFNPRAIASVDTLVTDGLFTLIGITHTGASMVIGDFDSIDDLFYWHGVISNALDA